MIKHLVIDQARRWLSNPQNRERLKQAGRSAWQAYQDSRKGRERDPADAKDTSRPDRRRERD
ncbi:hypothetical protein [uncultured Salinisphaera sp.]|uniref:hypothetical protein n=1 Tax=uncultured Salinisphaera sp. TaxID=359372 RepID=UPI0032B11AB9|tara:strand:+ start:10146 stop:10331 length:186 start_codon:yes stop_codon:yes gene_type:complete